MAKKLELTLIDIVKCLKSFGCMRLHNACEFVNFLKFIKLKNKIENLNRQGKHERRDVVLA